jgi:hypothetical protein
VGNKGSSQYFTDEAGTTYMCLTSGRCVQSRLVDLQQAPTSQGNLQNYWKFIDVSPHTVEFKRLASAAGMASRQGVMETSLIGGNALRITTCSGKFCKYQPLVTLQLLKPFVHQQQNATMIEALRAAALTRVQHQLQDLQQG